MAEHRLFAPHIRGGHDGTTSFFKTSGSSSTTETNIQTSVDAAEAAKVAAEAAQAAAETAEGNAAASQTAAAPSASAAAASEAGSVDFTTNGGTVGGDVTVSSDIGVTGNVDGRDVAADGTKLDGIETGATADQTDAEIKTLTKQRYQCVHRCSTD